MTPRQPILLSTSEDAPNLARNMLIADGEWRESALTYDRAFFLFGGRRSKMRGWRGNCCPAARASSAATGRSEGGKWVAKGLIASGLHVRPQRG